MDQNIDENGDLVEKKTPFQNKTYDSIHNTFTVDEYLIQIGQLGKFQIFVLLLFSLVFIVPGAQAFIMVFIADSPPWVCSGRNLFECNSTKSYTTYERCNMSRISWKFTKSKSYSIVTEV